jgi:hypothetical protein
MNEMKVIFLGCLALAIIGMVVYCIIRRWERNNPFCSKCGTRGKNVEPILLGGMHTSYVMCADCRSESTVGPGEYHWACILYDLYRNAKTMHVNICDVTEPYDVTLWQYWPKDDNERPLTLDEIMMLVLENG